MSGPYGRYGVDFARVDELARVMAVHGDENVALLARAYQVLRRTTGQRPLTAAQRRIYDYLAAFIRGYGYAPTFQQIAAEFGYNSLATVHEHLCNIERKGWIRRRFNEANGVTLVDEDEEVPA